MGALTVRNVDDDLIRRLKIRAAKKGISAEAEHRTLLREVLGEPQPAENLVEFLRNSPLRGIDLDGIEQRSVSEPVDL